MKPTPGPWKALHDADGDYAIFAGDNLITVTNSDTTWDEANARLIAAAPELLDALEGIDVIAGSNATDVTRIAAFDKVAAAIKKAKGE